MSTVEKAEPLILRFDHNVIEHLGLKLYQNRPTNVIAEMVSNSWDADSTRVWIDFNFDLSDPTKSRITIADDGIGMTPKIIREIYLVIGLPKRTKEHPDTRSPSGRHLMGRKGIGKLAPFGIATKVSIATVARLEQDGARSLSWFTMDLAKIREQQQQKTNAYYPEEILTNADPSRPENIAPSDTTGEVARFLNRIGTDASGSQRTNPTGTLVMLEGLTLKRALNAHNIIEAMGRRFTVTLLRDDFSVFINGDKVTEAAALPTFGQRIPENGLNIEQVNGREVRYWVGFVETAAWPADQAGIGVYAHGKIAQDRPFTFGQRGREIYARYMYGVIEADWLDELSEDVVSTDRTSVNWEHEETVPLYNWGQEKVRQWLNQQMKWRADEDKRKVRAIATERRASGKIPTYTEFENEQIIDMVAQIAPNLGKDVESEAARDRLLEAVANAWSARPVRELLKSIWDGLKHAGDLGSETMAAIVENLRSHSVPEALSLGVTFAQRAYALSLMYELIHRGREIDLQDLLEAFPWILDPRGALLTADRGLKKVVTETILADTSGDTRIGREVRALQTVKETERPDFVFLTGADGKDIFVVEIKHPSNPLTDDNRRQLSDYLDFLGRHYRHKTRNGVLIGNQKEGIENSDNRIRLMNWEELFAQSRYAYIEMMAAMLKAADPDPSDTRVKMMEEFGGEQTWELLRRMAKQDDELQELFNRFDAVKRAPSATVAQ